MATSRAPSRTSSTSSPNSKPSESLNRKNRSLDLWLATPMCAPADSANPWDTLSEKRRPQSREPLEAVKLRVGATPREKVDDKQMTHGKPSRKMRKESGKAPTVSQGRHEHQCRICAHAQLQEIEQEFVNWASPTKI